MTTPSSSSRAVRVLQVKLDIDEPFDWDAIAHTVREHDPNVAVHARSIVASLSVLGLDYFRGCGMTFPSSDAETCYIYVIQYRDGDNWIYHSHFMPV